MRRKPRPCPLCQEPTLADVCQRCQQAYDEGKKMLALRQVGDKKRYFFPQYAGRTPITLSRFEKTDEVFFVGDLIEKLIGEPVKYFASVGHQIVIDGKVADDVLLPMLWADSDSARLDYHAMAPYASAMLTERQAKMIRLLLRALWVTKEGSYLDGKRSGSSFVTKMANGELSIDDINQWTANLEKGRGE